MSGRLPVETAEKGLALRLHFEQKCQQSANHLGLRGAGDEDLATSACASETGQVHKGLESSPETSISLLTFCTTAARRRKELESGIRYPGCLSVCSIL